ncbi:unnamed protein product [Chrysoparadoxa australica]
MNPHHPGGDPGNMRGATGTPGGLMGGDMMGFVRMHGMQNTQGQVAGQQGVMQGSAMAQGGMAGQSVMVRQGNMGPAMGQAGMMNQGASSMPSAQQLAHQPVGGVMGQTVGGRPTPSHGTAAMGNQAMYSGATNGSYMGHAAAMLNQGDSFAGQVQGQALQQRGPNMGGVGVGSGGGSSGGVTMLNVGPIGTQPSQQQQQRGSMVWPPNTQGRILQAAQMQAMLHMQKQQQETNANATSLQMTGQGMGGIAQMPLAQHGQQGHMRIVQQQQQQQIYPLPLPPLQRQGRGTWQNDGDTLVRQKTAASIIQILRKRQPSNSEDWVQKLPVLAQRLEEALYQKSATREEYLNEATLKDRLQGLALSMGAKAQSRKMEQQQQQQQQEQQMKVGSFSGSGGSAPQVNTSQPEQQQQQQQPSLVPSSSLSKDQAPSTDASAPGQSALEKTEKTETPPAGDGAAAEVEATAKVEEVLDQGQGQDQAVAAKPEVEAIGAKGMAKGEGEPKVDPLPLPLVGTEIVGSDPAGQDQAVKTVVPAVKKDEGVGGKAPGMASAGKEAGGGMEGEARYTPEQRKQVLRQQQQRLLLLRHASTCTSKGNCLDTPHCAAMQTLWKHIAECRTQECQVPHCVSSRYVLWHYHRCREQQCELCSPVRDALRAHRDLNLQQGSGISLSKSLALLMDSDNSTNKGQDQQGSGPPATAGPGNAAAAAAVGVSLDASQQFLAAPQRPQQQQVQVQQGTQTIGQNAIPSGQLPVAGGSWGQVGGAVGGAFGGPTGGNATGAGVPAAGQQFMAGQLGGMGMPLVGQQPNSNMQVQLQARLQAQRQINAMQQQPNQSGQQQQQQQPQQGLSGNVFIPMQFQQQHVQLQQQQQQLQLQLQQRQHQWNQLNQMSQFNNNGQLQQAQLQNQQLQVRQQYMLQQQQLQQNQQQQQQQLLQQSQQQQQQQLQQQLQQNQQQQQQQWQISSVQQQSQVQQPWQMMGNANSNNQAGAQQTGQGFGSSGALQMQGGVGTLPSYSPAQTMTAERLAQVQSMKRRRQRQQEAGVGGNTGAPQGKVKRISKKIPAGSRPDSGVPLAAEGGGPLVPAVGARGDEAPKVAPKRVVEGTSLISYFSAEQCEQHLLALRTSTTETCHTVKQRCAPILKHLMDHQYGWIFNQPVNPQELNLADYFDVIKRPMDLGTVKKRLDGLGFRKFQDFFDDTALAFENAIAYNEDGSDVNRIATEMKAELTREFDKVMEEVREDEKQRLSKEDLCPLCGTAKLMFEPMVYYCNGQNCSNLRIRRNNYFYSEGTNQFHWCQSCHNELKDGEPVAVGDLTLQKTDLIKRKNDEMHEEPWVQCDQCKRWVHQVCALFNGRCNKSEVTYHCPACTIEHRKKQGVGAPTAKALGAADLPQTKCSEFMETAVRELLVKEYAKAAQERGGVPVEQSMQAAPIIIRQVSNVDRMHPVGKLLRERYSHLGYPSEFPCRSKCYILFQNLDGVDVVLFGMYVYEYGHKCAAPNQRRVYISYLDSVHYFHPRRYRTLVYQEVLIAYLGYVKARGFHTAHIWACPPLRGDDYILYSHPEDQKTPNDERLQQWYLTMLENAKKQGYVHSVSNLYAEHFSDIEADARVIPYLEGDYWIGEAEHILKEMEEEPAPEKKDNTAWELSTRSNVHHGTINRSKANKKASDKEPALKAFKDQLMAKLAQCLEPMKGSFLVARLHPPEFATAMAERLLKEVNASPGTEIALDETEDHDLPMECEAFDTRQAFLNLCQGNHYQFDMIRRAKHTSLMVLYHLHNPHAPKFMISCQNCMQEVSSSLRYHCDTCGYDLCEACYAKIGKRHHHPLKEVRVVDKEKVQTGLTKKQRLDRQRALALQMQYLAHAVSCNSTSCQSRPCAYLKKMLAHQSSCTANKTQKGCPLCRKVWALLQIHAKQCKSSHCKIPKVHWCSKCKRTCLSSLMKDQA